MEVVIKPNFLEESVVELRRSACLRVVALIGVVSYILTVWALWPVGGVSYTRLCIGLLGAEMAAASVLCHFLSRKSPAAASRLLVISLMVCTSVALFLLRSTDVLYLFIIPVIVAAFLLNTASSIGVTLFVTVLAIVGRHFGFLPELSTATILVLIMVAGTNLIVVGNLYNTLGWTLIGYDLARRNQDIARERKADLEQTLRSLEVTTNRLFRTNEALEYARAQADEARKLKQQFAQMISHELRTPLNLIVGFTEIMVKSPETYGVPFPPGYTRDLTIVYHNACHLQSLVNDVLDLARIDAAQMSLQIEETPLSDIVADAIRTAHGLVEAHHLDFFAEIDPPLPHVWVDPIRVRQIIYNLLSNAVRYTPVGNVRLRVYPCQREPGWMEFAVSDTGIGIPPDQLQAIFEPFQQAHAPGRVQKGGVGLGLTISQDLARMHGGNIRVESELATGSTFYFRFPIRPARGDYGRVVSPAQVTPRRTRDHDLVVLLVTHSLSAATMISRHLQGCRTITVRNLEQAEITARQIIPQMVVFDTLSLEMDSRTLSDQVKAWGLPETLIFLCSFPGEEVLRQQLGVYGYLIKPVTQSTLWDVLRPLNDATQSILVVDDDQNFTRLIERLLDNRLKRYRVLHAHSGHEALALAEKHAPDLILLDLELPDMDGALVIEHLRNVERLASIPVIVVSGNELNLSMSLRGEVTALRPSGISSTEVLTWLGALANVPVN